MPDATSTVARSSRPRRVIVSLIDHLGVRARKLLARSNRILLIELSRASLKVNDQDSLLGVTWNLLSPLAALVIFYVLFKTRFGAGVKNYPLHILLGVVLVNFFATAVRSLMVAFAVNRTLLLNAIVPRETLIAANLFTSVYKLLVELTACAILSMFYGQLSLSDVALAIPLLLSYVCMTLGFGLAAALAYSYARDVEHIWWLVSRLLFVATPVFYTLDSVSHRAQECLYWLNPLTPHLLALRSVLVASGEAGMLVYCHAAALGFLVLAASYCAFLLLEAAALERV